MTGRHVCVNFAHAGARVPFRVGFAAVGAPLRIDLQAVVVLYRCTCPGAGFVRCSFSNRLQGSHGGVLKSSKGLGGLHQSPDSPYDQHWHR